MTDAMDVGVAEFAVPVVATEEEPLCATVMETVKLSGCRAVAQPESQRTKTGEPLMYLERPNALACRVVALPFKVLVKAPDSAANEIKSVVVGLLTRLVEPFAEEDEPTWLVAAVVEIVCMAAAPAALASVNRLVCNCMRIALGAKVTAKGRPF